MKIDILCALPDLLESPFKAGVLERACSEGRLEVRVHDLHQLSPDPHKKIDDCPYGGGPGMVIRVDVVAVALEKLFGVSAGSVRESFPVILMTPQGGRFDQCTARAFAGEERLVFICGRYEGVDERIRKYLVSHEISLGDFVLSGGEVAAAVVIEAVARLLPGVLGNTESLEGESFQNGLLEYPHYTRPSKFGDWTVPEVLLSGNHKLIAGWREEKSLERTRDRRPDLLEEKD
ncbi:MAG: tRNA (guanosine(37)-N1)-methyltransferase TrmD [Actinobacteria bacterium]|nr:tRNA (guanosine(37)-N1)-methyltransferase TrmD [Actinomycetota bacterium]